MAVHAGQEVYSQVYRTGMQMEGQREPTGCSQTARLESYVEDDSKKKVSTPYGSSPPVVVANTTTSPVAASYRV